MKDIREDVKQIVCIVPKGKASYINKGLIEDHGIHAATFHHARGTSKSSVSAKGLGQQREKDVLQVAVPREIADEIFEYIFFRANMNLAHGGIVYMIEVPRTSIMNLPDIAAESST